MLLNQTQGSAEENAVLKRSVLALEARVDQLSVAGNANALCKQKVQTGHRHELTISGLAFRQVDEASLLLIGRAIAGTLKVNVPQGGFTSARLLRKIQPAPEPDHDELLERQPAAIKTTFAVVCSNQFTVGRMLAAKRSFEH